MRQKRLKGVKVTSCHRTGTKEDTKKTLFKTKLWQETCSFGWFRHTKQGGYCQRRKKRFSKEVTAFNLWGGEDINGVISAIATIKFNSEKLYFQHSLTWVTSTVEPEFGVFHTVSLEWSITTESSIAAPSRHTVGSYTRIKSQNKAYHKSCGWETWIIHSEYVDCTVVVLQSRL